MPEPTEPTKPIHTLVLDAGPLIKNLPPLSTLIAKSHALITTPSIISEIRDADARARIETLYLPFLTQRTPGPASMKLVSEFARKTGDREVLSRVDMEVIALAYELECERNGGDWRLRKAPGQKGLNGKPPAKEEEKKEDEKAEKEGENGDKETAETGVDAVTTDLESATLDDGSQGHGQDATETREGREVSNSESTEPTDAAPEDKDTDSNEDDDEGWITPSNLKKRQMRDEAVSATATPEQRTLQVATVTSDFALQNVLLQMNLNLLSPTSMQRIKHLKTFILRCHGCFYTTKELNKQFCPRCGKPTLTRVSCSTDSQGNFKMHLKANMQWNTRGDRYSIPKPVAGSSNNKWKGGGGKNGWGTELILAEDQKEYVRAMANEGRRSRKERDLMDDDYLPGILTGERNRAGGRIKVGAGRNVNSKKR
ncbi:Nin1 binding protein [Arachnomyces sp. PD_36]|nr:Nin1 binding protein [Arachnomyces sp. PD_36]